MWLVLARSKPSRTRMRAVASTSASTVARDLACDACFLGLVGGLRAIHSLQNASSEYERSLVLCPSTNGKRGDVVTTSDCAKLIHYKRWADGGLYRVVAGHLDRLADFDRGVLLQ